MSELCGEGEEVIRGSHYFIYCLGTNKEGLKFPVETGENSHIPPNIGVCAEHLSKIPKEDIFTKPDSIDGLIYGITGAIGITKLDGNWKENIICGTSRNASQNPEYIFVSESTMQKNLPNALRLITSEREAKEIFQKYEHLGIAKYSVLFDKKTGEPVCYIIGLGNKPNTFALDYFKAGKRIDYKKRAAVDIDLVVENVKNNVWRVHTKEESEKILDECYTATLRRMGISQPEEN